MTEVQRKYKKSTIIREGADIKRADASTHYVDNEKFYAALVKRREQVRTAVEEGRPVPKASDYIGMCFIAIANGLSMKWYFQKYPFRDELIGNAIEDMVKGVDSFNVDLPSKNPFSYFTQTAYYSFINTIRLEKKKLAAKFKVTLDALAFQAIWCSDDPDYSQLIAEENLPDVSYMAEFVKEFEESEAKKKRKKDKKEDEESFDLSKLDETGEVPE